ncbi:MAG: hypothetical protein A6D91_07115 [Bacillaceae bacterium G1]|nr:DUF1292 domain-containing protein [Bacillota bacterium]OJF18078.1 MAG: hypothetical protein A6D91_07115 [Bacillaceae bacterium G1]
MADKLEVGELITIPDEEGGEETFEVIMTFEVEDGRKYLMAVSTEETDDEEEEVYAFRYEEHGDDLDLFLIEDDEEWDMVEEMFNTLMEQEDDHDDHS